MHARVKAGKGDGNRYVEAKLAQYLAVICHKPLFQVLLDIKKSYNFLYQMRCMEILHRYGLGRNLQRILERLWEGQIVVTRMGGWYGR